VHAGTGAAVRGAQVGTSARGYAQALRLAERDAPGRRAWAIEGTGSYGAGLARFLATRGERVLERSKRERRSHVKTDALDARRAARSVLGTTRLATPRAGGRRPARHLRERTSSIGLPSINSVTQSMSFTLLTVSA
jgi:transposase